MSLTTHVLPLDGDRGVKLTNHLQLVLRSRMCGSIHPLPHMSSWHSTQLVKHRDNFILHVTLGAGRRSHILSIYS
jgi:hypothetical protein